MYLHELAIKNLGPIRELHVDIAFDDTNQPIPHIIVGRNGSGKTNFLAVIAEALMMGASSAFSDVLTQQGLGRSYFRILGGPTVSYGETGAYSVLRFRDADTTIFYHENAGSITTDQAISELSASLQPGVVWGGQEQSKAIGLEDKAAKEIFAGGVYAYFPASRSEHPSWFNKQSIATDDYDVSDKYTQLLGKPMFVEHGLDQFAQWLLGVLTESRVQVIASSIVPGEATTVTAQLEMGEFWQSQLPLTLANQMLQIILDDETASFYWAGRLNSRKVGVISQGRIHATGLDSLSGGQATLLAMFGTIMRYGDATQVAIPTAVKGIVIIDELDAHMHIDLQVKALPALIKMFPLIQFILSSHSPFFALGMEQTFTSAGMRMIDLPTGTPVSAEAYEEFQRALDAFRATNLFADVIKEAVQSRERPLVLLGGETDVKYFATAARVLGFPELETVFDWVGQTDELTGSGKFTGDSSLNQTVKFLRANPDFTGRRVVVAYDCDATVAEESFGTVDVIQLDQVSDAVCEKGVENLLPGSVFTDDVFETKEVVTGYGRRGAIPQLRKMVLCDRLCDPTQNDATVFEEFRPALTRIKELLNPALPGNVLAPEPYDASGGS